jgi:peptide-methionine (R)-S-oxide reductase
MEKIIKSLEEWKEDLPEQVFTICRLKGSEPAYAGRLYLPGVEGLFKCACCGNELFEARNKFDDDQGWPTFSKPVTESHVERKDDLLDEDAAARLACARCEAHLGHIYETPQGERFVLNDTCLDFVANESWSEPEDPFKVET